MKRLALLSALALLVACEQPTAPASSELELEPSFGVINNRQISFSESVFFPCALDGAGEEVLIQGTLHVLFGSTVDESGGIHEIYQLQPMGVTGTGLDSGDTYHAVSLTRVTMNFLTLPLNETDLYNFYIIGEGTGAKGKVHTTFHVTINANREVAAYVDNSWVTCS